MQSRQNRCQEELFVASPLHDLIPEDHLFKRVDAVLDLSWLHEAVRDCYCQDNGRPSIDPESALRLMLAGFFEGIVEDRRLMRRAQTDIAFRWFAGFRLDEKLPDHSSLTRIRQRWGAQRFEQIFEKTVQGCVAAGLVDGTTVHVDATLVEANASAASLTKRHVAQVQAGNRLSDDDSSDDDTPSPGGRGSGGGRPRIERRSTTDPDARMARGRKGQSFAWRYKNHTVCDDRAGVIVDVELTRADVNEGHVLIPQVLRTQHRTGQTIRTVTADKSYGHSQNYADLEALKIDPIIPPQSQRRHPGRIPLRRFRYDAKHHRVQCPGGRTLTRKGRSKKPQGWHYSARTQDCQACAHRPQCFSGKSKRKTIRISDGYEAILRAQRRHTRGWDDKTRNQYRRHRWRAEGIHGEAKTQHGLTRAARRGLANLKIQSYLTAAVMNLKRLAKAQQNHIARAMRYLTRIAYTTTAIHIYQPSPTSQTKQTA